MIGSVSASRRATAFAQALEKRQHTEAPPESTTDREAPGSALTERAARQQSPPADTGTPPAEDGAASERELLLSLAEELRELPRPELDSDVKTVQRAQLLAAMETACAENGTPETARIPHQRTTHRVSADHSGTHRSPSLGPLAKLLPNSRLGRGIAAGSLSFGVAASAFGGLASASTDALPGDSLYGLKRGMEDLRLHLASDDADRGQLYLDHAATRLQEARRLLERERAGQLGEESLGDVRRALSGVRNSAWEGQRLLSQAYRKDGDITRMEILSTFAENQRTGWAELRDRLPLQLTDVGDEVSSVLDSLENPTTPVAQRLPDSPHSDGATDVAAERPDRPHSPISPRDDHTDPARHGVEEKHSPSGEDGSHRNLLDGGLLTPSPQSQPREPDDDHGSLLTPRGTAERERPVGDDATTPRLAPEVTEPLGLDGEEWR